MLDDSSLKNWFEWIIWINYSLYKGNEVNKLQLHNVILVCHSRKENMCGWPESHAFHYRFSVIEIVFKRYDIPSILNYPLGLFEQTEQVTKYFSLQICKKFPNTNYRWWKFPEKGNGEWCKCLCILLVHRTHHCISISVYELGSSPSRFVLRERRCRRKNDIRLDFGVDADAAVFAIAESWRYFNEADDAIDDDENDDATDSAQSSSFGPSNVVDDFDLDTLFRKAVTARPNISLCSPSSLCYYF